MSLNDLLADGRECLRRSGMDSFALDAEVLLRYAAGLGRVELLTGLEKDIDVQAVDLYYKYLALREKGMPVAYIINSVEFMSLEFYVDRRVLIPRPDTEVLVERVLELIAARGAASVLELCTGSGCIAVALAHYARDLYITATDNSAEALAVARENARRHAVDTRVEFLEGDLFASVAGRRFDMLLANPPYIRTSDIPSLGCNVKDYEPIAALDGGGDGLWFYRRLCTGAAEVLNPGGVVLFETGYDQAAAVADMLVGYETGIIKDLSGHDRVVCGVLR